MTTVLRKLISGSDATKSRLHDQSGRMVPLGRLIRNGPRAALTWLGRVALDYRPARPWISYDASALLARRLDARSRVLEFGSGMSTIWYARHAGHVVSIEDYEPWYRKVRGQLVDNPRVSYRFVPTAADYATLPDEDAAQGFDLIMVDGGYRDACIDLAIRVVRPGGMIYLDNADRSHRNDHNGDAGAARENLLAFADRVGAEVRWFTDFAPTQAFVQGGLLVTVPPQGATRR